MTNGVQNSGVRPNLPLPSAGSGDAGAVSGVGQTEATTALGNLGNVAASEVQLPAGAVYNAGNPTGGLPEPDPGATASTAQLAASVAAMSSTGETMATSLETARLMASAGREIRKAMREQMSAVLDNQAQVAEDTAKQMEQAALTRMVTGMASAAVNLAFQGAALGMGGDGAKSAMSSAGGAMSGLIQKPGDYLAEQYDIEKTKLEATQARQEKQYQDASGTLGDAAEFDRAARDALRALLETPALGTIAHNL